MPRRPTAAILLAALTAVAACGSEGRRDEGLVVMTRNLYLGAPLEPLFAPASVIDLPGAVASLWSTVQASDPPARMAKVADEIAARSPDLVGLQEAALFQTTALLATSAGEATVYDFADLIVRALRDRGLGYRVVATSTNFSEQLPAGLGLLLRFTDRDVILARDGVTTTEPRDGRFRAQLQLTIAGTGLVVPRGWCSVLADDGSGPVRLWNTHLEAAADPVQEAQAQELVQLLAPEAGVVVLVGDLNSPADRSGTASYAVLRGAGFGDAWEATHPDPGLTCCFDPLLRSGALVSRIDVVLPRGALEATAAEVVGEEAADRTASGLWPSDHAGVSAALHLR
ncbi:MAG: endonuclease/exonuclease/phosphatase family protein [Anaeromyxobacteraceae bacterium]